MQQKLVKFVCDKCGTEETLRNERSAIEHAKPPKGWNCFMVTHVSKDAHRALLGSAIELCPTCSEDVVKAMGLSQVAQNRKRDSEKYLEEHPA